MFNSKKFIKATPLKSLRVQELENDPFEGIYLGVKKGTHGNNYLFYSEGHYIQIYGTKDLHHKMALVLPKYEVKIAFVQEVQLKDGNTFLEVDVEHSQNEVEGFDLDFHLDACGGGFIKG